MTDEIQSEKADNLEIYEVGYIIEPALSEADLQEVVASIKSAITDKEGSIISEEFPKKRELTYTMVKSVNAQNKRYSSGYFGWVKFELDASSINDIKVLLEKNLKIVRFLIIKTVRGNTLVYQRAPFIPRVDGERPVKREAPKMQEGVSPVEISEEELDKSIEKLIV